MKNKLFFIALLYVVSLKNNAQTITDIDGNIYNTVTIGTQTWMQENLKTTRFNNGINILTTSLPVFNDTNALYQWAYDGDTSNINSYGRLYTWLIATNSCNVCPQGWKVPNNSDWDTLRNFLGGELIAGGKMKEIGTTHWVVSDSSVNNSSGFTAVGSGFRGNPSGFSSLNEIGVFWSSTEFGNGGGYPRGFGFRLNSNDNTLVRSVAVGQNGRSIRCIKDVALSIENSSIPKAIRIFPNPATDRVTISLEEFRNYHLSMYDMMGNSIYEQTLADKTNSIEMAFLPKGTYILKLVSELHVYSHKFIKQ